MLTNSLKIFVIAILFFFFSCDSANTQTQESAKVIQSNSKVQNEQEIIFTEPVEFTGVKSNNKIPENIKSAWKDFVADGKYRLAQPFDMTFSEAAKAELPDQGRSPIIPYDYVWEDLGFNKRIGDNHLAAIVVDTTKTGNDNFGLVIFSPVKNTKDTYDINWLYRDANLSKTIVNRASGELYVANYSDDGSRKSCSVNWNQNLKKFECN